MLLSLLTTLLPLAAARPAGCPSGNGCTASSEGSFGWEVEGFDYHASYVFTTPAHQNSWGYVNFNLSNPALPYRAQCSAMSNQLSDFFYGNFWYNCTVPDDAPAPAAFATFEFDRATGRLDVNQTWQCDDQDPQYPITFHAAGTVNLTLECTDTQWQNPNWTMGQIYSDREIKCNPVDVHMVPYEISAVA